MVAILHPAELDTTFDPQAELRKAIADAKQDVDEAWEFLRTCNPYDQNEAHTDWTRANTRYKTLVEAGLITTLGYQK